MHFLGTAISVFFVHLLAVGSLLSQTPSPASTPRVLLALESDPELRELYVNINQKCIGRLSGEMWTLTHAYESKEAVDSVLNYFIDFFKAIESDNPKQIEKLEGAKGFKSSFGSFLESKDEAVRAFSSFVLGCVGAKSYAPKLAQIVNERDESFYDRFGGKPTFARGRAAMALGALQATEYKLDIAKLLKSKNASDRSGAIFALADMRALEFTREIVGVLTNKDIAFDDDDSPIYFLIETKQASNYKKEIVQAMLGESHENVPESAAYALAAIEAKEHAKDVARLLKNEFRRGDAAKALAMLGATRYKPEIARLLSSNSQITRQAAAVALAILGAKEYVPKLTTLCQKEPWAVADALVLLGKSNCYRSIPMSPGRTETQPALSEEDFHYFVKDRVVELNKSLERNYARETKRVAFTQTQR